MDLDLEKRGQAAVEAKKSGRIEPGPPPKGMELLWKVTDPGYVGTAAENWSSRCEASIRAEKIEVEKRYGIRIGQTEIYCVRCGRPCVPGTHPCFNEEIIPKWIPLDVDRGKWFEMVRDLQEEYNIAEGDKRDETSARRIAILLGEVYLSHYRELRTGKGIFANDPLLNVTIIEKDIFDMAVEYRLTCDPLERESRTKGDKKRVLYTWGVDKASGMERFTTQLKEWSALALLTTSERKEEEDGRKLSVAGDGNRGGVIENAEIETERTKIFEGRERDALRSNEQDEASLS